ncbi:hypothetical protein M8818_003981 [Zalaria obscura]|uniref:Uncharacterized protein n=1 Tax=Zalaria obscura TaxID=2024903 RepID=A0ACC3SF58_9PEZI
MWLRVPDDSCREHPTTWNSATLSPTFGEARACGLSNMYVPGWTMPCRPVSPLDEGERFRLYRPTYPFVGLAYVLYSSHRVPRRGRGGGPRGPRRDERPPRREDFPRDGVQKKVPLILS